MVGFILLLLNSTGARMKLLYVALTSLVSIGFPHAAFAQDTSQCSDVLQDGTFQTANYRDNSYFQHIIWSRFIRSTYESASSDTSGGFGVPIGKIVLGGNFSRDEYEAKKESIRKEYFSQINSAREIDVALSSGDPTIVEAWRSCMVAKGGGLTARFEPSTARQVILVLDYLPQGTRNSVRLTDRINLPQGVTAGNGSGCLNRGRRIVAGNACRVELTIDRADRALVLTANADHSSDDAFLPARVMLSRQSRRLPQDRLPVLRTKAFRQSLRPSHTFQLTNEEMQAGWMIDRDSLQHQLVVDYKVYWSNYCDKPYVRLTDSSFVYGFHIYTGRNRARNSSIICHINVTGLMRRDRWIPMEDTGTDKGPGDSVAQDALWSLDAPSVY